MDPSTVLLLTRVLNAAFVIGVVAYLYLLSRRDTRLENRLEQSRREAAEIALLISRGTWVITSREFMNQQESERARDDVFDTIIGVCPQGREDDEREFFTGPVVRALLRRERDWVKPGTRISFEIPWRVDPGDRFDLASLIRCWPVSREEAAA